MEIKRYDDFSSLKPIEDRIEEVIDLFPEIDDLIDIFNSIEDIKIQHITPSLYRSAAISYKSWFGGIYLDEVKYFDLQKTGDRSVLEELYFQEIIYPEKTFEEWFTKKWRGFSLKFFEIKDDKIKPKNNLAPSYIVDLKVIDETLNRFNLREKEEFSNIIKEMNTYLDSRGLRWIWLNEFKDSRLKILVISNKYFKK